MRVIIFGIALSFFMITHAQASLATSTEKNTSIELTLKAQERVAVPVLLVVAGEHREKLSPIIELVKKACEFTGEVVITVKEEKLPQRKKDVCCVDEQGFMRVCYFTIDQEHNAIQWRLYDPAEVEMLAGKSFKIEHAHDQAVAYGLADSIWPELTGQEGFFSTKIAYCVKKESQKLNNHKYRHIRHVYMCDYDGSNPVCIVDQPTLNIAPRWGRDSKHPRIYYSRCTASNMQLLEVDMQGKSRIVLDADGLNMLPSFAPSGNGVAYNNGGDIMIKRRDPLTRTVNYIKITHTPGNYVSPNLLDNGDVIFCSDFETKNPHIYYYHAQTGHNECLTRDGYCCCPCFSSAKNKMVYTKLVKGISQLYIYDFSTKKHEQITFDAGHKDEPSYSPCGNFIVFSIEGQGECRIAWMHLATKERKYLTPQGQQATYPSWSPRYKVFPCFKQEKKSEHPRIT